MTLSLTATKRALKGKDLTDLRKRGTMPGVVYGPKQESTPIEMPLIDFTKILKEAGESTVVNLSVEGATHTVLIHEVDRDPVTNTPRHVDFYAVQKGQKVEVSVPIEFTGVAPAVKELEGNLVKALHELTIKAEATNLPHSIAVDVSSLDQLDKQILAKEIALPAGVTLVTNPEEVVVLVTAAKEEEELPVAAPDLSAIEISEERGKKEEEGTAEAPAA